MRTCRSKDILDDDNDNDSQDHGDEEKKEQEQDEEEEIKQNNKKLNYDLTNNWTQELDTKWNRVTSTSFFIDSNDGLCLCVVQ